MLYSTAIGAAIGAALASDAPAPHTTIVTATKSVLPPTSGTTAVTASTIAIWPAIAASTHTPCSVPRVVFVSYK